MGKQFKTDIQNNTLGEGADVNNKYLEYLIQVSCPLFPRLEPLAQDRDDIQEAFLKA